MLVTDRFTYVHMPKTGGTFVTEVLSRLHATEPPASRLGRITERLRSVTRRGDAGRRGTWSRYGPMVDLEPKHGTCHDIPEAHRGKPILATVRSPYEWYVSQYEFAWWKRTAEYYPEAHPTPAGQALSRVLPGFEAEHPHFPEISFPEFVELCDRAAATCDADGSHGLGLYTHGFARYFCTDAAALGEGSDADGAERLRAHLFEVHFIDTARVKSGLVEYLASVGYLPEDLAFVEGLGRILPMGIGRREDQGWEGYYTPERKRLVRERDRVLFELFPEFDV